MRDRNLDITLAALVATLWAALCAAAASGGAGTDLAAFWIAARVWEMGGGAEIYAFSESEFFSADSPLWRAAAAEAGLSAPLFPYVYPPIWAALAAPLAALTPWPAFQGIGAFLLLLALGLSPIAVRRLAGGRASRTAWTAGGLALVTVGQPFLVALPQAQPQLLVTALTLFAMAWELRGRGRWAPHLAGGALGLAAALKLTPAVVALWWLATGRLRAIPAFVILGGGLGFAQLLALPLEMTGAYLSRLAAISALVIETPVNHALEHGLLILSGGAGAGGTTTRQPFWIGLATPLALVAGLGATWWRARRAAPWRQAAAGGLAVWLWAVLCGPLAWSHHLLAGALAAPALPLLLGPRVGIPLAALAQGLFAAPVWAPALGADLAGRETLWALPGMAAGLIVAGGAFAALRPEAEARRP